MIFRWTQEGADPREWEFTPLTLGNAEAETIERLTNWTYQEFGEKFLGGSMKAYHALLYVFLKRTTPTLKYNDVQFSLAEIDLEYSPDEKRAMVDALREKDGQEGLTEDEESLLASLEDGLEVPDDEAPLEPTAIASSTDESGTPLN